jgi:hypothetical protein
LMLAAYYLKLFLMNQAIRVGAHKTADVVD